MRRLICNYLKIIFRSPLYRLAYLFLLAAFSFFFVCFNFYLSDDTVNYFDGFQRMEYFEFALYIVAFCMAVFFAQKPSLLEEICFVPRKKICLSHLFASYLAAVIVLFIAWIYLTIGAVAEHVTILYWLRTILYASCRWGSILSWMTTIGFFCGWIVTSKYAYLFSIPFTLLFSVFNHWILCGRGTLGFENCWFARLICLQRVEIGSTSLVFRGPLLDAEMASKTGFVLALCAVFAAFLYLISQKRFRMRTVCVLCICLLCTGVCAGLYRQLRPAVYDVYQKLYPPIIAQSAVVRSYTGEIWMREWSAYSLDIEIEQASGTVVLRLDESIRVKELQVDQASVSYQRVDDELILDAPTDRFVLHIEALGRVSYFDFAGTRSIYTSVSGCCLPPNFAFLPSIGGDETEKEYDLTIHSVQTLASNLHARANGTTYTIQDRGSTVCFFTGDLQTFTHDGIRFIVARYDMRQNEETYVASYREKNEYLTHMDPKTGEISREAWGEMKTVFLLTYQTTGSFPTVFDDFVLIPVS